MYRRVVMCYDYNVVVVVTAGEKVSLRLVRLCLVQKSSAFFFPLKKSNVHFFFSYIQVGVLCKIRNNIINFTSIHTYVMCSTRICLCTNSYYYILARGVESTTWREIFIH